MEFKLQAKFKPTGDQPQAIDKLVKGLKRGYQHQTLLGVTGSGKTYVMACVIEKIQKPTLVISHNKTLAAQLASEFKEFFPDNAVHYFVSYYDYYLPESYKPQTDTYIEKETEVNEEIDRLRHASTNALLTRKDVLIVASVSCIYGLGSPADYQDMRISLIVGLKVKRDKLLRQLTDLQYQRNDYDFYRGNFRVKGDVLDVFPIEAKNEVIRVEFNGDAIEKLSIIDILADIQIPSSKLQAPNKSQLLKLVPSQGEGFKTCPEPSRGGQNINIFPAKHFVTPEERLKQSIKNIEEEMKEQVNKFKQEGRLIEAQRIEERTHYDLEMIQETGYCNGIENYSRYLTGRNPGEPPATLLEYFPDDFLLFIDESHVTIPQLNAMPNGDRARKQILVDFGFRLPSALDNRPLKFKEFGENINQAIYVSATPAAYEYRMSGVKTAKARVGALEKDVVDYKDLGLRIKDSDSAVTQQVIRPTGLLEPKIEVRKTKHQIQDLIKEITQTVKKKQRVLVTTLTKRLAEELTEYLQEQNIKVQYLHSEIDTLDRIDIIRDLRLGKYDVLVGINLLREGLDLPEVSLVAILDADKEGFLRSETSLIQTMGRAARHVEGRVIMYADIITGSMKRAIAEVNRRRKIQEEYNLRHHIVPVSIVKEVKVENVRLKTEDYKITLRLRSGQERLKDYKQIPKDELKHIIEDLENQMNLAAENLEFERAAELRDQIKLLKRGKYKD